MTENEKLAAFRTRLDEVLTKARLMFGVSLNPLTIGYNVKGRVAGWAGCKRCMGQKTFTLRFNPTFLIKDFDDMINDTIPHEVAHLVCHENPAYGRQHDKGWRSVCLQLGGNGQRCHAYEMGEDALKNYFDYVTDAGHVVQLGPKHHIKLQSGRTTWFRFRGKGKIYRTSRWCRHGETMPDVSPTAKADLPAVIQPWRITNVVNTIQAGRIAIINVPVHRPVTPPVFQGMSKAAQVRQWIAFAKKTGRGQDNVIAMAMTELKMSQSQASRYVTENWSKVFG